MRITQFRLPLKPDRLYSGNLVDRTRTLNFLLDGHAYSGFAGDSVLSAVLASGTDAFGLYRGAMLGLDDSLQPPVIPVGLTHDPRRAMAMSATPIVDGMELVSLASPDVSALKLRSRLAAGLNRLRKRRRSSLQLDPESISPTPGPWTEIDPEEVLDADLVVIGGGVSGMSAAREAADRGWSVIVLEQLPALGGDAEFFGSTEGEPRAMDLVRTLTDALRDDVNVQIMTRTDAFGLSAGLILAHQTEVNGPSPHARVVGFKAKHLLLATGAKERLPLFSGNRLPGVIGARAAHRLACQYGVWRGSRAIVVTSSNAATQLALQAADLGVEVVRLADSRAAPLSRFFDFAKAYGISLATGLRVAEVGITPTGSLAAALELSISESSADREELEADRLVVCGGWQPDLSLWHMAGGSTAWDAERQQLRAVGDLTQIALAGVCAGAETMSACCESGRIAVCQLAGENRVAKKPVADPIFESCDGQLPISVPVESHPMCFLDAGHSFAVLPPKTKEGFVRRLLKSDPDVSEFEPRALSLNDVAAKVVLKDISPEFAGPFAQERCVVPGELRTGGDGLPEVNVDTPVAAPPAYLVGRFGRLERTVLLIAEEGQNVGTGCLIFADSGETRPEKAVGVVIADSTDAGGAILAYGNSEEIAARQRFITRNGSKTIQLFVAAAPAP